MLCVTGWGGSMNDITQILESRELSKRLQQKSKPCIPRDALLAIDHKHEEIKLAKELANMELENL